MQLYPFSALLGRMKYIHRWSLMRAARTESLAEHTAETAQLAHLLFQRHPVQNVLDLLLRQFFRRGLGRLLRLLGCLWRL